MNGIQTSFFDLFKIGPGPSSSHTYGPMIAASHFMKAVSHLGLPTLKRAKKIKIRLYGSLSATGKGHGTDKAIVAGLKGIRPQDCDPQELIALSKGKSWQFHVNAHALTLSATDIHFDKIIHDHPYSNTLIFTLLDHTRTPLLERVYYSIGGGFVLCKGERPKKRPAPPYPYMSMAQLKQKLKTRRLGLCELLLENEKALTGRSESEIHQDLDKILDAMEMAVGRGIHASAGTLPGPIKLKRKAPELYKKARRHTDRTEKFLASLNAYAFAVSEENAAGHRVVTAPTSGAAGLIPGMIYVLKHHKHVSQTKLREGLMVAAAIGFLIKQNASLSGAEVGCQGEVGAASAMAAALCAYVHDRNIHIIENAAEIALEHHLGMTCDPIGGFVQIPCIERNAVGAVKAYNAYLLASDIDPKKQKVSLDTVISALWRTGKDMSTKYKETAKGGLALSDIMC